MFMNFFKKYERFKKHLKASSIEETIFEPYGQGEEYSEKKNIKM